MSLSLHARSVPEHKREKAQRYDTTWGQVSSQVISHILDFAEPLPGKTLLDCGCGPGRLCAEARSRGAKVLGCDHFEQMIEIAKANYPALSFQIEDVEALRSPCR